MPQVCLDDTGWTRGMPYKAFWSMAKHNWSRVGYNIAEASPKQHKVLHALCTNLVAMYGKQGQQAKHQMWTTVVILS